MVPKEDILRWISISISFIMIIGISVVGILHLRLYSLKQNILSSIKFITVIANTCTFIGCIALFTMFMEIKIQNESILSQQFYIHKGISNICVNIMNISAYFIFLIRLNHAFKGSVFEISHKINILLLSFFILYIIPYIYVHYHIFDYYSESDIKMELSHHDLRTNLRIANIIIIAAESMMSITLLLIFNGSLLKLVKTMESSQIIRDSMLSRNYMHKSEHFRNEQSTDSIEMTVSDPSKQKIKNHKSTAITKLLTETYNFNERQQRLMRVVTRTTILATISVFSSIGLHLMYAFTDPLHRALLAWIMRDFQCVYYLLEITCLYLNYAANDWIYMKICCGCNYICYCFCVKIYNHTTPKQFKCDNQ